MPGELPRAETLPAALIARLREAAPRVAMHLPEGAGWTSTTWEDSAARVHALVAWLRAQGVQSGARVAILGAPDLRWVEADFATQLCGAASVGIYPTLTPEQILWQLRHAEVRVLLGGPEHLARLPAEALADAGVHAARWDVAHPELRPAAPPREAILAALAADAARVAPEDACTIFYTSGTTGDPKGVVLTHHAVMSTVRATREVLPLEPGATSLVFLPLAHSLQRVVLYRGLLEDVEAWIVPSLERVAEVLPLACPSILATVPRMLEKVLARAEATARAKGPRAARIFAWAMEVARRVSVRRERGEPLPLTLRAEALLAEKLAWDKLRARMGGRLRTLVCGGARLDPTVARVFHGMGLEVLEGWGLTETCGPATLNAPGDARFGTVGRPLPGMEIRLDADGEVLVRGAGLFSGYWRAPEATAEALTPEGWFRTGDVGVLEDGRLSIVDRKKELLVTSGGKNVAPVPIETSLEGGIFPQVIVLGDDRPYLAALFAPDLEAARTLGPAALRAEARSRVEAHNSRAASFEQVRRFEVLEGPFTVEDGLLTPTLKLRRKPILARHAAVVDKLYAMPRA